MDSETKAAFASLAKLVEDNSQSLQAEMAAMRTDLRTEIESLRGDMDRGFERVEAATRRNTTTIVGGGAAIVALNRWAKQRDQLDTKRDRVDTKRDRELRELRARLSKVERALKRRSG